MPSNPALRWCFTINNPTDSDKFWEQNQNEIKYLILQEERGANGTDHWQGFLILKKKKRFEWLRRHFNGRAHWEIAKGTTQQCIEYCEKEETRVEGGYSVEIGERPSIEPAPKASIRLAEAAEELDSLKEHFKRPREIKSMTLLQCGFIAAYNAMTADILGPYRENLRIVTMVGPPGCGKSYSINKLFPNHGRCIIGNGGTWFLNPTERVMVFEEFTGQIQLQRMLQFLDPYPMALEVKGGMRPAMYEVVIITSNTRPDGWYPVSETDFDKKRDAIHAMWDRIGFSNGSYVPVRNCGVYLEAPTMMPINEMRQWFLSELAKATNYVEEVDSD